MGMKLSVTELSKIMAMRAGKSIAGLSKELGFNSRASLSGMVLRGTMQVDLLETYAELCGFKLVAVPMDTDVENGLEIAGREIENE